MGLLSILLVDDDESIVDGIRRSLRAVRNEVRVDFATSAEDALASLERARPNVVVTDLRMPGVDGVALLRRIEEIDPSVVRIVLSGEGLSPLLVRALGIAHRVIGKPCAVAELLEICRKAFLMRQRMFAPGIRAVVNRISKLPSPPEVYRRVEEAVAREASLHDIGAIVAEDPAMSAKLLQASNSAFFGGRRPITSAQQAVTILGLEMTKSLLLTCGLQNSLESATPGGRAMLEDGWRRVKRIAALASQVAENGGADRSEVASCYSAAILHDIGRLVILSEFLTNEAEIQRLASQEGIPLCEAEQRVIGADHAQLGAYLLTLWGLPDDVAEVALRHEDPLESFGPQISDKLACTVAANWVDERERMNLLTAQEWNPDEPKGSIFTFIERARAAVAAKSAG